MERNSGMSPHAVLGVPADASVEEIRAAYQRRARELHPDRHLGSVGSITVEEHDELCALNRALGGALAAAPLPTPSPGASQVSAAGKHTDALEALLSLPGRTSGEWSDEQIKTWAQLVMPAARRALPDAAASAARAGATGEQDAITATAQVLLGHALTALGARAEVLTEQVGPAYEVLERSLPAPVVAALPPRVTLTGDPFRARALATLVAVGLAGLAVLELDRLTALLG